MPPQRYSKKQIVEILRKVDTLTDGGLTVPQACRRLGLPELTYHRWRHKYGDGTLDSLRRVERLEAENVRLRRIVAEQADHIKQLVAD